MKKTYRRTKYILYAACEGINQPYDFYYSKGYSDKYGFHYRDYTGNMIHIKNQNGHNIFSSKAKMENAGILACTIGKTYHIISSDREFNQCSITLAKLNSEVQNRGNTITTYAGE